MTMLFHVAELFLDHHLHTMQHLMWKWVPEWRNLETPSLIRVADTQDAHFLKTMVLLPHLLYNLITLWLFTLCPLFICWIYWIQGLFSCCAFSPFYCISVAVTAPPIGLANVHNLSCFYGTMQNVGKKKSTVEDNFGPMNMSLYVVFSVSAVYSETDYIYT